MKRFTFTMLLLAAGLLFAGSAYAEPVGGADCSATILPGDMQDTYNVMYYGGESAVVAVRGDGGTNINVFVYDDLGNLVTFESGYSDQVTLSWIPRWTGDFRIVVENTSFFSNAYVICFE